MYSEQFPPTGQSKQWKLLCSLWKIRTFFPEISDDMCNDPLLSVYVYRTQGVHMNVPCVTLWFTFDSSATNKEMFKPINVG